MLRTLAPEREQAAVAEDEALHHDDGGHRDDRRGGPQQHRREGTADEVAGRSAGHGEVDHLGREDEGRRHPHARDGARAQERARAAGRGADAGRPRAPCTRSPRGSRESRPERACATSARESSHGDGAAGSSSKMSASGSASTTRPAAASWSRGTSRKRATNARDGRSVSDCPVDLRRYVVATAASVASTRRRFSLPALAPVAAAAPSAMQEYCTSWGVWCDDLEIEALALEPQPGERVLAHAVAGDDPWASAAVDGGDPRDDVVARRGAGRPGAPGARRPGARGRNGRQ